MRAVCSAAAVLLAGSTVSYAGNLGAEQIQAALVGKSLHFTGKAGSGVTTYSPDGSAAITFNGKPDKGKWRTDGENMCMTWTKIRSGKEGCYTVQSVGGNKYQTSNGFTLTAE